MSAEERVEAVTGLHEVILLACDRCGALMCDIDAHYKHAHPVRENG